MKAVKLLLKLLAGLAALILLFGLIQPKHFEYERSTSIDAPKEAIFKKINNLKSWEEWGPWKQIDSTIEVTYGEKTEGLGASYSWIGDKKLSGSGTITVTESTPSSFLKTALDFNGSGGGDGWFRFEDGENGGTTAFWGMGFDIPYPFNAFTIFNSSEDEQSINDMFDSGLANLKTLCESEAKSAGNFEIQTVDFPGRSFLAIRGKVKIGSGDMHQFYSRNFGAIGGVLNDKGLEMAGHPSGLFYEWNEETNVPDMAAGIPVLNGETAAGGNVEYVEVPAGKTLLIDYYGPYEGVGSAHYAMGDYLEAHNLTFRGPVIEEYVTDPGTEPDTSKWLTKVYYCYE
jgi:effector-binding domain-containing protein